MTSVVLASLSNAVKARAITPSSTVVGRVTQTLTIECKAKLNLNDTEVTFTWMMGDKVIRMNTKNVSASDGGIAKDAYDISELSTGEHNGTSIECRPENAIGVYNSTWFTISVELFPPPVITTFAFQPDSKDAIVVKWQPVNVTGYPRVSVERYFIELARDKDRSVIVANATVTRDNVSHVFPVDECSINYWVRIKAVSSKQDISNFTKWTPTKAVGCPLISDEPGTYVQGTYSSYPMHAYRPR